jgi:hypothetical protein
VTTLLNGPLEIGLRILVILETEFPRALNVDELLVLDHLSLHSGDFGGPPSLHPALPLRAADVGARRDAIRHGIELLIHRGLATADFEGSGISFVASETSHSVVFLLESPYLKVFKERAVWTSAKNLIDTPDELREQLSAIVRSWPETASMGVEK